MALPQISESEQRRSTRERLLQAAAEVFLEKGYVGTRVQEIARRAGLTTGAIYGIFESKAALLSEAILAQGAEAFSKMNASLVADRPAAETAVTFATEALAGDPQPFHPLLLEAFASSLRDEETRARLRDSTAEIDEQIREVIERARKAGVLDDAVSADALATFIRVMLVGSLVAKAMSLPAADIEEARELMQRMFTSLAPQTTRPS
ncbi:MAG: hypothetical protein JJLCMIEE_02993 [Acidimicrobiales bacterium]|nr:hypothetical protein [Acidimicrobiales bacterium]